MTNTIAINDNDASTSASALSIESAAEVLGVSSSTIRNWVKLGYIDSVECNLIDAKSLENFEKEAIGTHKLNSRANKQRKIHSDATPSYDKTQWQSYELSLSESHRNIEGIYYTPEDVVADLCSRIKPCDFSSKIFLDPCCGSGNFLIYALKMGFAPQNIYGYDTDPNGVEITIKRIEELTGYKTTNIKCTDFLEHADTTPLRADYIFTNPPWGKKYDAARRKELTFRYNTSRSVDSSSLFLYASLPLLKRGGQIGFLLQEAFFNIASYADIRKRLFTLKIEYLIDYGRPFKSLLTKAQAIVATNSRPKNSPIICQHRESSYPRSRKSFACNPNLIFNLNTSAQESELIERLLTSPHSTLRGCAHWGLGVVTGNNQKFCSDTPQKGYRELYRGSDITPQGFKPPSLYVNGDMSLYQQVAAIDMYDVPCKLVYRFISSKLCFVCDTEQRLILNSANFLILFDTFPIAAEELVKFLNCDFTNWLFQRIFSTRKVLRGDLESLPIFLECFEGGLFSEDRYLELLNIERVAPNSYCMRNKN